MYAKNYISRNLCRKLIPKFPSYAVFVRNIFQKAHQEPSMPKLWVQKLYAKIQNQFLWLQFDCFRNCDGLRMKFRRDFFNRSRFSDLHWFGYCYFCFQNLFLKWQNIFFCWNFKFWIFYWKFSWSNSIICLIASFTFA